MHLLTPHNSRQPIQLNNDRLTLFYSSDFTKHRALKVGDHINHANKFHQITDIYIASAPKTPIKSVHNRCLCISYPYRWLLKKNKVMFYIIEMQEKSAA